MRKNGGVAWVVTCEHGGNRVPPAFRPLFVGAGPLLASHRGWDPGAAPLARFLAGVLGAPIHLATLSRLVVDLNRSAHNPRVFSERTRILPRAQRRAMLERYHTPHREAVAATVAALAEEGRQVVHLAVHTFTPVLDGETRRADLSLLYDPSRPSERGLCGEWIGGLARRLEGMAVRRNQPYRGASDGLTTWLRTRHPDRRYVGIEIEVNQRLLSPGGRFPAAIGQGLVETLPGAPRGGSFPA